MEPAYIRLTPDGYWALYAGDGGEAEATILAVGQPFEPGAAMLTAVAELEAWATDAGYTLVTPHFSGSDMPLDALIEPDSDDDLFDASEPATD